MSSGQTQCSERLDRRSRLGVVNITEVPPGMATPLLFPPSPLHAIKPVGVIVSDSFAFLLAAHPHLLSPVLRVINRAISTFLTKQAGLKCTEAQTGAVTLIQRFGSVANLNIHLHCLFLDGVYRITDEGPVFQPVRTPTAEQLQTLLNQVIKRVMKLLTRLDYLIEEQGVTYMAETDSDSAMTPLQSAACTYRIALGPRAGQKVLSLQTVPSFKAQDTPQRCVNQQGFSLHAAVRCARSKRNKLEQLCRYITRPAIANERLKLNSAGDVVLHPEVHGC